MKIRNPRILLSVLATGALALSVSTGAAQVTTIYQDNFTGSNSTPLNGSSPTIDNGPMAGFDTWAAVSGWQDDGSYTASGAATLPFSPGDGYIYTLSADLSITSGAALQFTFGNADVFAPNNSFGFRLDSAGGGNDTLYYTDPTGAADFSSGITVPDNELASITLDTTGATWMASYTYNGTLVGTQTISNPAAYASVVGFSAGLFGPATGQLQDFSLTQGSPVPEPGTIWSVALGLLSLVGFQVRRSRFARA